MVEDPEIGWRIGELSRRVGVSTDLLRAWERRYGVLSPRRSSSGQRLYTREDEQRVRDMQAAMQRGYSPAVAARLALSDADVSRRAESRGAVGGGGLHGAADPVAAGAIAAAVSLGRLRESLRDRLDAFDDAGANAVLDRLLVAHGVAAAICDALLPLLREIGDRWAHNEVTIAQEHFASALLGGRLRALAHGWDEGSAPRVLAACPPGEAHELGLLCFSVLLRERGYRISYLGGSVPCDSLFDAAERLQPDALVVAGVREEPFWDAYEGLSELSDRFSMALGGAGATDALGRHLRARVLPQDPRRAVEALPLIVSP